MIEFFDQRIDPNLFVFDHLLAREDRRTRHTFTIEYVEPFRARPLDQNGACHHQPFRRMDDAPGRRFEAFVEKPFRLTERTTHTAPLVIRNRTRGDVTVSRLEDEVLRDLRTR